MSLPAPGKTASPALSHSASAVSLEQLPLNGMAMREPLGLETRQLPTLVTPPRVTGRLNTWQTVDCGSTTLPFLVSRPVDGGVANAVV